MTLKLHNTLTRSLDPFVPMDAAGRRVLLYSCGPTVYSFAHIGNFRSFLLSDLLRRVLLRRGYDVRHVMNITDVGHMTQDHLADATGEDKLAKAARELGWDPFVVARHFESAFAADAKLLGMANYGANEADDPSLHPRATRFIPEMLVLIQRLLDAGYAYTDDRGQAYFEIAKFPEYGQLSGKQLDELDPGTRVEVRAEKRDPRDFALWKVDGRHLMQWDPHTGTGFDPEDWRRFKTLLPGGISSSIGCGFPGWHIECSAMASACLGDLVDIHTGGEDNVFPHHECEIAQSCAASGQSAPGLAPGVKSFARYWVHSRHLLVNNRKMSKSEGTFFTVRDLLDPVNAGRTELATQLEAAGFAGGKVQPPVIRYALMSTSYMLPMNFTVDTLVQSRANVARLQTRYERLQEVISTGAADAEQSAQTVQALIERSREAFDSALDDNLDFPRAAAAAGHFVSELNRLELGTVSATLARDFMDELDLVLGVLSRQVRQGMVTFAELTARAEQTALSEADLPALAPEKERVEEWLAARQRAKKDKQYAFADTIRQRLQEVGVVIEDAAGGVRWRLKE
jgi:cysteinyl-tRNA synthetase